MHGKQLNLKTIKQFEIKKQTMRLVFHLVNGVLHGAWVVSLCSVLYLLNNPALSNSFNN